MNFSTLPKMSRLILRRHNQLFSAARTRNLKLNTPSTNLLASRNLASAAPAASTSSSTQKISQLVDEIANLTLLEVADLNKALKVSAFLISFSEFTCNCVLHFVLLII